MIPLWAFLALISAITVAAKEIVIKSSLNKHLDKSYVIFGEHIILAIITLFFFIKIQFYSFSSMWHYYLAKALIIVTAMELYYYLLQKYEISKVAPLANLSPMFLILFSAIFLSEKLSLIQFAGIFLIVCGTYFLEIDIKHHDKKNSQRHYLNWLKGLNWKNISIMLATLILYSFLAILDKLILKQVSVYSNLFYTSLFVTILFALYYSYKKSLKKAIKVAMKDSSIMIFSALSFISAITILYAIAIPDSLVSLIFPIKRTATLFIALFGGMLFHESHILKKVLAVIVMLAGIVLIVL
ncbi:MAG: EamA family transporter [Candidatus Woesearchaeota archaeon]